VWSDGGGPTVTGVTSSDLPEVVTCLLHLCANMMVAMLGHARKHVCLSVIYEEV